MIKSANLGFPRMGLNRELKKAVESYWKSNLTLDELLSTAKELRQRHWDHHRENNIDFIPSNDFSFYDHVLDTSCLLGVVPERYNWDGNTIDLDLYFAMARGKQDQGTDVVAMEMTKWFDTNYHYIVPELTKNTQFKLSSNKIFSEFEEAKSQGITTRPVLLGPVSYLLLSKTTDESNALSHINAIVDVYKEILTKLSGLGAEWIQLDEPCLVLDLSNEAKEAYKTAYATLKNTPLKKMLSTYFGGLRDNLSLATDLNTDGLHIDLVRAPDQLDMVLSACNDQTLSLGVIDGRNIWKTDLEKALNIIETASEKKSHDQLVIAPSCSLLHSPVDLDDEEKLDDEFKSWLAFSRQKLKELSLLKEKINTNSEASNKAFEENKSDIENREKSTRIHNQEVKKRTSNLSESDAERQSPFSERIKAQEEKYNFPLLPTTTIGSFPQTTDVRHTRSQFKKGDISREDYDKFIAEKTIEAIRWQEEIDIDVPVHGEFERNDMVEYFGEKLSGYEFTRNGWVQSYGSRCVKPPIIFGDVSRLEPMTVRWSSFAQEKTNRPVKGMLSGPITMLQWAFVRDDQPREITCKQIALALRDEVVDLESAGITIIQIDEPALREGLPLRNADKANYLKWAVDSFKISSAGVQDSTQIHTHMCYCEFNDIIDSIAALDADVISIETSRSAMELLDAFVEFKYPNEVGPGVYDIHSPRIPKTEEMVFLLEKALKVLNPKQVWVNPDCGLKTRGWNEVKPALENMVSAAKQLRKKLETKTTAVETSLEN